MSEDIYRLPFASPGNSHDFEEGENSTKEWKEMTWDTRPPLDDPDKKGDQSLIDPETGAPVCIPKDFNKDYRSLTHQGRIRICNDYFLPNGGSFASFLAPETRMNPGTKKFETPHFNERGWFPDPHEYFLDDGKIKVRLRASASEKPVGEFITVPPEEIGTAAHQALATYLASLNNDVSDSGAEKTQDGFVMDDNTDVKPDAENGFRDKIREAKTGGNSQVEFTFNDALESIFGKSTLQECFVSLVRYGYFKEATSVDIKNLKVSFTLEAAQYFLDQVFGQKYLANYRGKTQGETIRDYTGPTSGSIQYYFYGGEDKRTNHYDSVMESMAVYRARENAFTTPVEKNYDYSTAAAQKDMTFGTVKDEYKAHTLYLPVLYNTKTKQVEVVTGPLAQYPDGTSFVDSAWFKDNSTVTDGFNLPPGYRLPTEEELVGFRENSDGDVIYTPQGTLYAEIGLSIVNDENMFVLSSTANSNTLPLLAVAQFYQPVTEAQLASDKEFYTNYNNVDDTFSEIWLTYDQAFALGDLVVAARSELGAEMAMRRRSDLGFQYEYGNGAEPVYSVDEGIFDYNFILYEAVATDLGFRAPGRKVASYAIKFDPGIFAGAIARIQKILDETSGDTVEIEGFSMTRDQAEELINALEGAERGMWEQMSKWGTKNADGLLGGAVSAMMSGIAFALVMILGKALFIKYSARFRELIKVEYRVLGQAQAEGIQDRHGDKGAQKKTIDQFAPSLFEERQSIDHHEKIGRNPEIKKILRYFADRKRGKTKEQFGLFHGEGGTGKTDLHTAIADSLRLGFYPDGTPVETWIRDLFKDVRVFNVKDAIAGASFENEAEGYIQQVLAYQKAHPDCLIILDEVKDIATAGSTSTDPTSYLNRLFKTIEFQSIMFTLATEDVPDFLIALNRNPGQWKRRLEPILQGGWVIGMRDLEPHYVVDILKGIVRTSMTSYSEDSNVDLSSFTEDLYRAIVRGAQTRRDYGDPSRSINEFSAYMAQLIQDAEGQPTKLKPTLANYQQFIRNNPTGDEALVAAKNRPPIPDSAFVNPKAAPVTGASPGAPAGSTSVPLTTEEILTQKYAVDPAALSSGNLSAIIIGRLRSHIPENPTHPNYYAANRLFVEVTAVYSVLSERYKNDPRFVDRAVSLVFAQRWNEIATSMETKTPIQRKPFTAIIEEDLAKKRTSDAETARLRDLARNLDEIRWREKLAEERDPFRSVEKDKK